jgi:hypothetical protein
MICIGEGGDFKERGGERGRGDHVDWGGVSGSN